MSTPPLRFHSTPRLPITETAFPRKAKTMLRRRYAIVASACLLFCVQGSQGQTWRELFEEAQSLASSGNLDSAIVIGGRALESARSDAGEPDTSLALVLHQLGRWNDKKENYEVAIGLIKDALLIQEHKLGLDHRVTANTINDLGLAYKHAADYQLAEENLRRALDIRIRSLDSTHLDVANSYNNLGILCYEQGRFLEAESLYLKALAIRKGALGAKHVDVAAVFNNLGVLFYDQGMYSRAESFLQQTYSIWEEQLRSNDTRLADVMTNLANIRGDQNRVDEGVVLQERALKIYETAYGPNHTDVAMASSNLAVLYVARGEKRRAVALFQRALSIREQRLPPDHPFIAVSLNNLGNLYIELGRFAEAETLVTRAVMAGRDALGPEHPLVGNFIQNLGSIRQYQTRYAEAESLFTHTLEIYDKAIGPEHPDVALCLEALNDCRRLMGSSGKAFEDAKRAHTLRIKNFRSVAGEMAERDALTFSDVMRQCMNRLVSTYLDWKGSTPGAERELAASILTSKGLVSEEMSVRSAILLAENRPRAAALVARWQTLKKDLAELFALKPPSGDVARYELYNYYLDSLSRQSDKLENQILRQSARFRKISDYQNVTVKRIASLLPPGSTLIEYLRYDYYGPARQDGLARYLALVLDGSGTPEVIDLGLAKPIDDAVKRYREHFSGLAKKHQPTDFADQRAFDTLSSNLHELIWKPVTPFLNSRGLVLIAPDGGLNLVSFAGLLDPKGRYLIQDHPLHYVSAGRDLIRLTDGVKSGKGLVALGNPDYDAPPRARVSRAFGENRSPETTLSSGGAIVDNLRSVCRSLNGLTVGPLAGSGAEVATVAEYWKQAHRDEVASVLTEALASEENFKQSTRGKRTVHLATHGYYLQGECSPSDDRSNPAGVSSRENPLLLSGILLAGSNLHGSGADTLGIEDGIVTALEISGMDFRGTDLVVLSACETGLGEVKQGEGVYGLRRAFQMAGARTVVSALWQISDTETLTFMKDLYAQQAPSYPELLQKVAVERIRQLKARGRPTHPRSWGAFVATGDWRMR